MMNIADILRVLGYEILSINNGIYGVKYTAERQKDYSEAIEKKTIPPFDVCETMYICVGEVSFNGFGNLFVQFVEADDRSSIWDTYEYRNMDKIYS